MTLSQNSRLARAMREGEPLPVGDPLKLPFVRLLEGVTRLRLSEAFRRMVLMTACALTGGQQEALYLDAIRGLAREDLDVLVRASAQLVLDMEARPFRDLLGPVYMEIGHKIDRQANGEFFTPHEVSALMAELALGPDPRAAFPSDAPLDVHEPAGGTGGMLLAFVETLVRRGVSPAHVRVTTWDLSATSSYAAFVNLTLYGVPATVVCGDTLRMDVRWTWRNPFWALASPLPPPDDGDLQGLLDALARLFAPAPPSRPKGSS